MQACVHIHLHLCITNMISVQYIYSALKKSLFICLMYCIHLDSWIIESSDNQSLDMPAPLYYIINNVTACVLSCAHFCWDDILKVESKQ